jgi:hypothetical protein
LISLLAETGVHILPTIVLLKLDFTVFSEESQYFFHRFSTIISLSTISVSKNPLANDLVEHLAKRFSHKKWKCTQIRSVIQNVCAGKQQYSFGVMMSNTPTTPIHSIALD